MQTRCECRERHLRRRIVLTGGPGAGKTAVLELLRHSLCEHLLILPEAAGVIFGGGFPRHPEPGFRYVVGPTDDFMEKASSALAILREELPACCRDHTSHAIDSAKEANHVLAP